MLLIEIFFMRGEMTERDTGDVLLQPRERRDVLHVVCGEGRALAGPEIIGGRILAGYYQA